MRLSLFLICVLLILINLIPVSGQTSFDTKINSQKSLNWHTTDAELRDLSNVEGYRYGVGGINVPGGDIEITTYLFNEYDVFNLFKGDRLFQSASVEFDMEITAGNYSDWHLLVLPITMNGSNFFYLLFDKIEFVENLTRSIRLQSYIENNVAYYQGDYNGTHIVDYSWDTSNGLLIQKEVTSDSGKKLIVVQGKGSGFGLAPGFSVLTIFVSLLVVGFLKKKSIKKIS